MSDLFFRLKETCPWCGSENVDAEFVDVEVGEVQVSPYTCGDCYACEINYGHAAFSEIDPYEERVGWMRGPDGPEIPHCLDLGPKPAPSTEAE